MGSDANKKQAQTSRLSTLWRKCTPRKAILIFVCFLSILHFLWNSETNTTKSSTRERSHHRRSGEKHQTYHEASAKAPLNESTSNESINDLDSDDGDAKAKMKASNSEQQSQSTVHDEIPPKFRANFPARKHPRVLFYDSDANDAFINPPFEFQLPTELGAAGKSYPNKSSESNENDAETCVPINKEWQNRIYPSCNVNHELAIRPETGSVQFIACGGDRCAFRIQDQIQEVVMKMSKFRKEFAPHRYEDARHDGMAMERLQASPYVLDIYGYCGLSQVIEPGDEGGGALHDLIKTTRLKGGDSLSMIDRMKILYQLVSGVADMHSFEKNGLASLVHNDICCHQFILTKGVYKLNDFHLAHFQEKDRKTNVVCPAHNSYSDWYKTIRSPEEIAYMLGRTKQRYILLEKSDVYTLGNVMYYVFTMRWLFEDVSVGDDSAKKVTKGERSPFPEKILQSQDRATRAMRKAIEMCWTHDPEKRPTANEVRQFLGKELKAVLGVEDLGIIRVDSIEQLPVGYQYSDNDFNSMF